MANLMKRLAMGVNVLFLIILGIIIGKPTDLAYLILLGMMTLWMGLEFYIGFFRTYEGTVPPHPFKSARMMWPLFVVYSWLDFRYHWTRIGVSSWIIGLLLVLCLTGLFIRAGAVFHLGKSFSYDVKRPAGKVLIQSGLYRKIRHPSYLGILILSSCPPLILGSIPGFVGMTLSTALFTVSRLQAEEKVLEAEFGAAYLEYKRNSYRLLPYIY